MMILMVSAFLGNYHFICCFPLSCTHAYLADFIDTTLGTSTKHLACRKLADEQYRINAQRMKERYGKKKKSQTFEVGDEVTVRIPKIDRAATDMHRLPCIIVDVRGKKYFLYRLLCEYGVLNTWFSDGDLEVYPGSLEFDSKKWKYSSPISLREASKKANPRNHYYGQTCNCKKGCIRKSCSCWKANKPCSTRCHSGKPCSNFEEKEMIIEEPSPKRFKAEVKVNDLNILVNHNTVFSSCYT